MRLTEPKKIQWLPTKIIAWESSLDTSMASTWAPCSPKSQILMEQSWRRFTSRVALVSRPPWKDLTSDTRGSSKYLTSGLPMTCGWSRPDSPSNWRAWDLDDRSLQSVDTCERLPMNCLKKRGEHGGTIKMVNNPKGESGKNQLQMWLTHIFGLEGELGFHSFGNHLTMLSS